MNVGNQRMIKVGIVGAAGYAAGELIRVLLNHPQAEIVFANSGSNAGNLFSDVHEGLLGDTDFRFTFCLSAWGMARVRNSLKTIPCPRT